MPLVLAQCSAQKAGGDPEMIESCLQALESFVLRCPKEIAPHEHDIANASLNFLGYDPNYGDDDGTSNSDDDLEDEASDEEDYSDDDDVSWKVRRASAKVISAIIVSRPDTLVDFVARFAPALISRFQEREENVRMDIFATFNDLVSQASFCSPCHAAPSSVNICTRVPRVRLSQVKVQRTAETAAGGSVGQEARSCASLLLHEVPRVVKATCRQMKVKSVRTRIAAFSCLRQLASTLPGCLVDHVSAFMPGVKNALGDTGSNNLLLEVLSFLQVALSSHPAAVFQPYMEALVPLVLILVKHRYYKISVEALRVCCEMVLVLRPHPPADEFDFRPFVQPLFASVKARLLAQDQDQEVKECAISCMGLVLCHFADADAAELSSCLPILLDRMRNEITRTTTIKTFAALASATIDTGLMSPMPNAKATVLQTVVTELSAFLRKSNRPLRQASKDRARRCPRARSPHLPASHTHAGLTWRAEHHHPGAWLETCAQRTWRLAGGATEPCGRVRLAHGAPLFGSGLHNRSHNQGQPRTEGGRDHFAEGGGSARIARPTGLCAAFTSQSLHGACAPRCSGTQFPVADLAAPRNTICEVCADECTGCNLASCCRVLHQRSNGGATRCNDSNICRFGLRGAERAHSYAFLAVPGRDRA